MAVIGGVILVLAAVLIGFTMAGGHVHALLHLSEFVTIGGASLGALIIMAPKKVFKDVIRSTVQVIKGTPFNKPMHVEMLGLVGALAKLVRRDGFLALESVVTDPANSPVLANYPKVNGNPHVRHFLCDALSLLVDGKADPKVLAHALEDEVKVIEREHHAAVAVLAKTADALPGFGIVAAVLGIVVTMGAIDGPASEIGHKVGAALVGTFLGILMSYGGFAPMAGRMEVLGEIEGTFFKSMSAGIVGICEGENPRDVVARARRVLGTDVRPTQDELNAIFREGA